MVKTKKSKASATATQPQRDERYESALRWFAAARGILSRLGDDALELVNAVADDESLGKYLDTNDLRNLYDAIMEAFDRAAEASPSPRCPVFVPSPLPK